MTKFTAFVIIVALRIVFHPSHAQTAPFTNAFPNGSSGGASPLSPSTTPIIPTKNNDHQFDEKPAIKKNFNQNHQS